MALRVKVEPLDSWVDFTVNEALSPEARSRAVADFAREQLFDALADNKAALGTDTPYEQFVNGRKGAPLESAHPDRGTIIFEFELIRDVLLWIMAALIERSPRQSGRYRDSHTLFADGRQADIGSVPQAEEYSFLNPMPYSRKLEIGKTKSGRDFLISVPNRIYERTAKDARARFGNVAKVTFSYRAAAGGQFFQISRIGPLQVKRNSKGRFIKGSHVRAGNQTERNLRVPAIIVRTN